MKKKCAAYILTFVILLSVGFFAARAPTSTASIYLDYQATTPVDPRVLKHMLPYFTKEFGNPHSTTHVYGTLAHKAMENARSEVACVINADPEEIIFTSGATEANNLAILGVCRALKKLGKSEIISVVTEHESVLQPLRQLEKEGFTIILLPVQKNGIIKIEDLKKALSSKTALVSIMTANNEIGVIQPIRKIARLSHESGALFHTDAAQAFGKIKMDVKRDKIDLLSLSGHKIYGPKGIGALFIKKGITLIPISYGGGQEMGLRPGTVPVPLCVGLGKASEISQKELLVETKRLLVLRDTFLKLLQTSFPDIVINGDLEQRLPGNLSISFRNIDSLSLQENLKNVAISLGSACTSSSTGISHAIQAIHGKEIIPTVTIRVSIGRFTSKKDIETAASELISFIKTEKGKKNDVQ